MEKMFGSTTRWIARVASLLAVAALAACGGGGGGGGTPVNAKGTLQMSMTDAPQCGYDHVYVTVDQVSVNMNANASDSDGGWTNLSLPGGPKRIDLLNLTNGVLYDLGSATLPAGTYHQIRLKLAPNTTAPYANAVQPTGDTEHALKTPSGQQSGLKLLANFTVQPDQVTDLVLDFDACKSVVKAGNSGQYILKPVIKVYPKVVPSIQGYVTTTMALSTTTVSAQQNGTVVRSTVPDANGKFVLAYLPTGTYTVVITSDDRATGVVNSVPVGTGTTMVTGTTTAIVLPTSVMNTVTGTVSATTVNGSTTTTVPVTDATVTAYQDLTSGPTILVDSTPVDADNGTYMFHLPAAAPQVAPYSTSGTTTGLTFTADTSVAGEYRLVATAPGRSPLTRTANVSGGAATADFKY